MAKPIIDYRITIGNVITICTLIVSMIVAIASYTATIEQHSDRLDIVEQNQKVLESRINLLEKEMQSKQSQLDKMETELNRTVEYLELLLDKEGIKYVK